MRTKVVLLLFGALAGGVAASVDGDFPRFYAIGDPGAAAAFAEEAKADYSVIYEHDGKLSIGIGEVRDGVHQPIRFTFDELSSFWRKQRNKSFIVVTLSKEARTEDEARKVVARLTDYFFGCGFQRVRIHRAYGSGVGVYSDATNPGKNNETHPK